MISPQYTPFAEHEVRHALGLTRQAYIQAVRSGALARSVHFDCRVSPTTALHSLVDVVRFDAIRGNAPERIPRTGFAKQCDWWLDELCGLDDDWEELGRIAITGDARKLMRLVLPADTAPVNYASPANWHKELTVLAVVVNSWCRCYRALHEMLVADEVRCNAQCFGEGLSSGRSGTKLSQLDPLAA